MALGARDIELLSTDELLRLPPREWLMKGVIPKEGLCGLVAPPECLKTFVALDWAMCISEGLDWHGHEAEQAPAVYIAAEGGRGIQQRVRAWMTAHNLKKLPAMYWLLEPLYVREEGAVEEFLEQLEAKDIWPGLLVVDTLSRSFGGGEENASADMGWFVERMTMLAKGRRMAALIVHHMNAQGSRERGHTAFKGGLDTMFICKVDRDKATDRIKLLTVSNAKQKDDERSDAVYLVPKVIGASLVLEGTEAPVAKEKGAAATQFMRKKDMLTVLGAAEEGMTWQEWRLATGIDKDRFNRRVKKLTADSDIFKENGRYFVMPANKDLIGDDENEG